jgi:hypothetical protein
MDRFAATELDAPPGGPSFAAGLAQVVAGLDQILAAVPGFDTDPAPADGLLPPGYRCESMNGHPIDPATAIAAALIGHVRRVVIDERSVVIDQSRKMRLFRDNAAIAARMTATTTASATTATASNASETAPSPSTAPTAPASSDPQRVRHSGAPARQRAAPGHGQRDAGSGCAVSSLLELRPSMTNGRGRRRTRPALRR